MKKVGSFTSLARAGKRVVARALGHGQDNHLSFISYYTIPQLRTLTVEPDDISTEHVKIQFSHAHRSLKVVFSDEHHTFVFREDDVMVLSSIPFSSRSFQEKLEAALLRRATRTTTAPLHSLMRG